MTGPEEPMQPKPVQPKPMRTKPHRTQAGRSKAEGRKTEGPRAGRVKAEGVRAGRAEPGRARPMHLAAHVPGAGDTDVRADPRSGPRIDFASFERLARTAERGLFDLLLLAEKPRLREHEGTIHDLDVAGRPESLTLLNALAAVTGRLGLAATAGTTFNEPYELARRLATLDHLSGGRAAWNVVTSSDASTGENFRRGGFRDRAERYTRAAEFVATARELWDSWAPDGTPRPFAHQGRHFDIAGEFGLPRPPQGHPVVVRAGDFEEGDGEGDSDEGREFAASSADVIFSGWGSGGRPPGEHSTRHGALEADRAFYADVKRRLAKYGRGPDDLKIMSGVTVVLGDTAAEAHERAEEIRRQQASPQTAPLTRGAPQFLVGTPGEVAAELVESVARDAADGFVLVPHPTRGGLDEFVDRVVPLLQERGAFRTAYEGTTLRSHLGLADPVRKD